MEIRWEDKINKFEFVNKINKAKKILRNKDVDFKYLSNKMNKNFDSLSKINKKKFVNKITNFINYKEIHTVKEAVYTMIFYNSYNKNKFVCER